MALYVVNTTIEVDADSLKEVSIKFLALGDNESIFIKDYQIISKYQMLFGDENL